MVQIDPTNKLLFTHVSIAYPLPHSASLWFVLRLTILVLIPMQRCSQEDIEIRNRQNRGILHSCSPEQKSETLFCINSWDTWISFSVLPDKM